MGIVENYIRMQEQEKATQEWRESWKRWNNPDESGRTYTIADNYRVMREREEAERRYQESWQRVKSFW